MRKKAMRNVSIMTELSTEKVELARKAPSVAKDLSNLDDRLRKAESKRKGVERWFWWSTKR